MVNDYSIDVLDGLDDQALMQLDWKNLQCLNGRLLELHAEGMLGNEYLAKLPRKPILCIDQIEHIDDSNIAASFTFPNAASWPYDTDEPLEMLFQDQLDQLVGFWGSRKADGIGRALSSGVCQLYQSLNFTPGKTIYFQLDKKKWVVNKATGTGTAIFDGRIVDADNQLILETKKVIVGILLPADIMALREQFGGQQGVTAGEDSSTLSALTIPVYEAETKVTESADEDVIASVVATQAIAPDLWPLRFHFRGDPVVPGNFGTHGMITLLKETAHEHFDLNDPVFKSLTVKKFSGMIFEDPKQIRFELRDVSQAADGAVVAALANLYLENEAGERLIETPIYTFKNLTVVERS